MQNTRTVFYRNGTLVMMLISFYFILVASIIYLNPEKTLDQKVWKNNLFSQCTEQAKKYEFKVTENKSKNELIIEQMDSSRWDEWIASSSHLFSYCSGFDVLTWCIGNNCTSNKGDSFFRMQLEYKGQQD